MMRCRRFERLAALALVAGARVLPTGDGAFVAQHQGQRVPLHSLRAVAEWLASVAPEHGRTVEVAALRDTRFQRAMNTARKQAQRAARAGGQR